MKIKNNRVIKCVTCLVTCFMLVLAGIATPANASSILPGTYDPADYIRDITISGDTKTISYDFSDVSQIFRFWDNGSGVVNDFYDHASFRLNADSSRVAIACWPLGVQIGNYDLTDGGSLYVGEILPSSPIDFDFDVSLLIRWDNGGQPFDLSVIISPSFFLFDATGKFIGSVNQDATTVNYRLGDTTLSLSDIVSVSGTIPANAKYIAPKIGFDFSYAKQEQMTVEVDIQGLSTLFSVDINTILENSNQMQAINNKLDGIISGTPEQNQNANNSAGTVEDQKDQIGDLVDQMTPSRPNTDHIDTDINAIAGDYATDLFADGMSGILNHPLILSMLSIVAVVSFIGYVLFGKVG